MCTFKVFLRWYNNKDVVPTLEAMQKLLVFYHKKGIDMLKLGCTLPNLAHICLHKSTSAKFYPFTETYKDLLQKIREFMVGGLSIVFTRKAVVDETFIRKSRIICKAIFGVKPSQLYLILCARPCQLDYTRNGSMTQNLTGSNINKTNPETLRTLLCHNSKYKDLTVKLRVSTPQELRKRLIVSEQMVFAHNVILCLRLWVASTTTIHVRKHDPL